MTKESESSSQCPSNQEKGYKVLEEMMGLRDQLYKALEEVRGLIAGFQGWRRSMEGRIKSVEDNASRDKREILAKISESDNASVSRDNETNSTMIVIQKDLAKLLVIVQANEQVTKPIRTITEKVKNSSVVIVVGSALLAFTYAIIYALNGDPELLKALFKR